MYFLLQDLACDRAFFCWLSLSGRTIRWLVPISLLLRLLNILQLSDIVFLLPHMTGEHKNWVSFGGKEGHRNIHISVHPRNESGSQRCFHLRLQCRPLMMGFLIINRRVHSCVSSDSRKSLIIALSWNPVPASRLSEVSTREARVYHPGKSGNEFFWNLILSLN